MFCPYIIGISGCNKFEAYKKNNNLVGGGADVRLTIINRQLQQMTWHFFFFTSSKVPSQLVTHATLTQQTKKFPQVFRKINRRSSQDRAKKERAFGSERRDVKGVITWCSGG